MKISLKHFTYFLNRQLTMDDEDLERSYQAGWFELLEMVPNEELGKMNFHYGILDAFLEGGDPQTAEVMGVQYYNGPFGKNNVYVVMNKKMIDCCKKLYGDCESQFDRLQKLVSAEINNEDWEVDYSLFYEVVWTDFLECNKEHFNQICDSTDNEYGGNKFYDIFNVDDRKTSCTSTSSDDCCAVAFNGLEAYLAFLLHQNRDDWNDLENHMAYQAACARAGVIDTIEESIPETSDIRIVRKKVEKLFVFPRYIVTQNVNGEDNEAEAEGEDPIKNSLYDFFASAELEMVPEAMMVLKMLEKHLDQKSQLQYRPLFSFDKAFPILTEAYDKWMKIVQAATSDADQYCVRGSSLSSSESC